ncbi:GH92 family glycosyl hydrolase [Polaribacter gangjinensis]|uniref:Alpha-mannosidase n=1 Tax=Polaribacter gangjinensis TaxID=574710 RepID=A0A2S7WFB1_9FLAO|nr:GH92 family glycosyl hydrolase [Polaribacter gangjinensis]PQJ75932.1 alpha-mannosidase [Polaribacter gangjinensis]
MKNIKGYIVLIGLGLLLIYSFGYKTEKDLKSSTDNTKYVNTFIGTGGHGHTFPGATTPYGMVQLSPDTRTLGWDACGGYHYSDNSILGFSHTHLSGTGISDLGDFLFMPFKGEAKINPGTPENPDSGYRSRFYHKDEKCSPGFYSVLLKDYNIQASLTATTRAGFHKYVFKDGGKSGIIIDLSHNIYPDNKPRHEFKLISDTEIAGYKGSGGWATNQNIFFNAKFNKPFSCSFYEDGKKIEKLPNYYSKKLVAVLSFDTKPNEEVLVKVGISSVDYQGAKKNLDAEIKHWNFDKVTTEAHEKWKKELSKIEVSGGTETEKKIFYTSLYHTSIAPNIFSDVDNRYRGMDQKIYKSTSKNTYTVFSLWDTFRAFNPLKTITDPTRTSEFISTLLTKYDQGGVLPMWELHANYTGCMIGYHSVPVIVDAYQKGIRGFDIEKAYQAIVHASKYDTINVKFPSKQVQKLLMPKGKWYHQNQPYIPADLENESVSKALEYAYNDWCIAQMAKQLDKIDDYNYFMSRSKKYVEYYDSETGFMRGKNSDGKWREPFDPRFSRHRKDDYTEGNAFQWSWFVPHDVDGLVKLVGGKDAFIKKLDELFSTSSELVGDEVSNDISGLIGQYAHGNEPSHHITHFYNFVDQPWKTQELADKIMSELYFDNPNGLAGNEDCGQMSAWYVLNAMGFYSFNPGDPTYSIGRPIFDKVTINLESGKKFTIKVIHNSKTNKYIQKMTLNNKVLQKPFFKHEDILNGGVLEFTMGNLPK